MQESKIYTPKHKIRIVTAASLFDGHDAAINIMRRIIQSSGAEVIHLGHDRSAQEVVECAIQEDANAIAMTSYQGGHMEYFKYMYDLLKERGCGHIKIFGGGGGTILPEEISELQDYGIARIYHPDDGRAMGLQGMINDMLQKCDFATGVNLNGEIKELTKKNSKAIARLISCAENNHSEFEKLYPEITTSISNKAKQSPVLGITGTGGAGKSSIVDELVRRFLLEFKDKNIAIISIDPSKRKTGGALLGDRIRMNSIRNSRVYMRSLATRQSNLALSRYVQEALDIVKAAQFDLIILETSGIGQSDTEITEHSDVSLYVMTPEYGAATQLEKIDMLDFADLIALNKFDKRGAMDALRDVKKQYKRNHKLFDIADDKVPVFGTIASQFNDPGMNQLYKSVMNTITAKTGADLKSDYHTTEEMSEKVFIIPPHRTRYLSEISENNRHYDRWVEEQSELAQKLYSLYESMQIIKGAAADELKKQYDILERSFDGNNKKLLEDFPAKTAEYSKDYYEFKVRDKVLKIKTFDESLSHNKIPKVAFPKYKAWGDLLKWILLENVPGEFPFTAGVFRFKREGEDPTRMFAGEGCPERTNKRFHYVSLGMPAKRLSTAFDSVTLYGNDPDHRPDIYGKIGNSGVSVCCLDDAKKLYSGFNLCDPATSVSMTINGPASIIAAYFMNAAIDQQCEIYIRQNGLEKEVEKKIADEFSKNKSGRPEYNYDIPEGNNALGLMLLGITGDKVLPKDVYDKIKTDTLKQVRGTVQADILKEDQAQNTCIFSTEFSLRLMGDMQQYFIDKAIRNFYSVSI
ncbi:MAG TPA: methylmalonyl-CoA mutase family protein, partial [Bacteroidia bacterium]|nr:methylmalonyl-CoA mutase family protein [Bacteroidia bacterium]